MNNRNHNHNHNHNHNRKGDKMDNHTYEHENGANQVGSFIAGLLIGGLAGAVAMLLLAPQSGKKTRAQIQEKSIELRDQTTEAVEDALKQTRTKARQITADVREKADELEQRGQDVVDEQKENWATLVKAGKAAIHS
jgi:gas vesicle protein